MVCSQRAVSEASSRSRLSSTNVPQVVLDGALVLRRGWHDAGVEDRAVLGQLVAVVEDAAGSLGAAMAHTGPGRHVERGPVGLLVGVDQGERRLARVHHLDGPHHDAAVGVAARPVEPGLAGGLRGARREEARVEVVAGQGADQVALAATEVGVERRRVTDLLLRHVVEELLLAHIKASVRHERPCSDRVVARIAQRDERVVLLVVGEVEAGDPADGLQRVVAGLFEAGGERGQLAPGGHPVEATDLHVDRVDRPPAHQLDELVAGLLQPQATLEGGPLEGRQLDGVGQAEEVGGVQHVHVQRVALDPLAAVEEPPQLLEGPVHGHAAGVLDRPAGAHLVGDRADAADAGGQVGRLGVGPAPEEGLEEARRLVDAHLHVDDLPVAGLDVHGPFAFDTGERLDVQAAAAGRLVGHPDIPSRRRVRSRVRLTGTPTAAGAAANRASLSSRNGWRPAVERPQQPHEIGRGQRRRAPARRPGRRCSAPPSGRSTRSSRGGRRGTAPRSRRGWPGRGRVCRGPPSRRCCRAACTPRRRCVRAPRAGGRAGTRASTSTSWRLSIGQPRSSKSTGTWAAIGVLSASVVMNSGCA